jgi:hypothetical protein
MSRQYCLTNVLLGLSKPVDLYGFFGIFKFLPPDQPVIQSRNQWTCRNMELCSSNQNYGRMDCSPQACLWPLQRKIPLERKFPKSRCRTLQHICACGSKNTASRIAPFEQMNDTFCCASHCGFQSTRFIVRANREIRVWVSSENSENVI